MKKEFWYPIVMVLIAVLGAASLMLLAVSVKADEQPSIVLRVPAERAAQCGQRGGCALITRDEFLSAMAEAYAQGAHETSVKCGKDI